MTPADLQIPERGSAPVDDPAVVAGKEAEAAKAEWLALPADTPADEETPEYKAAVKLLTKAENAFADAPVTSMAGGLVKLRALLKDLVEDDAAHYATAHVETVLAFMEGFAGEAQAEPLIELWAERNRLVASCRALETDLEIDALGDKLSAVEHQIANTEARTLAGVVVQIKLRESVLGHDHWVLSAALTRNVVKALERMGGSVVTKPDPVVTLFAEWGAIQDEATALSAANPEAKTGELNDRWEAAVDRRDVVGDKIMETPATSMRGVAIKIRLASHYVFEGGDLHRRHATPARDIDYVEADPGAGASGLYVVSALRDAERLAGVS